MVVPTSPRWLLPAALLATVCSVAPQPAPRAADPLDPNARVPAVVHPSPLAGYRRLADEPQLPWKAANDRVAQVGGWRVYLREATRPDGPASAASAASAGSAGSAGSAASAQASAASVPGRAGASR